MIMKILNWLAAALVVFLLLVALEGEFGPFIADSPDVEGTVVQQQADKWFQKILIRDPLKHTVVTVGPAVAIDTIVLDNSTYIRVSFIPDSVMYYILNQVFK